MPERRMQMKFASLCMMLMVVLVTPVFADEEKDDMSRHEMMMGEEVYDTEDLNGDDESMPMYMGGGMGMCGMMGKGMGMAGHAGKGMGMMGCGMVMGMGYDSPGYESRMKKFLDDTVDLRREIHARMFDYHEALRNDEATGDDIVELEKKIYDLQEQVRDKAPLFMRHRGMMGGGMGW